MKTLLLETATEKSFIGLVLEKSSLSKPLVGGPLLSKEIALEISALLKENEKPDRIAVGSGPGSLTGIRVGLSLAKSLALGWKIPCFEFCSLKTFVPTNLGPFAVLIDARSQGIHVLIGDKQEKKTLWETPLLLLPEHLSSLVSSIPTLISPHPHLIEPRIQRPCAPSAPFQGRSLGSLKDLDIWDLI